MKWLLNDTSYWTVLWLKRVWRGSLRKCCPLPLLSGTPGQLLSAEPAGLTWVGSSQPPRRTCLHLVSGVWLVQLCCPVSPRERGRRGERALVSSVCDVGPSFPLVNKKKNTRTPSKPGSSLAVITFSNQCITHRLSPLAANPSYSGKVIWPLNGNLRAKFEQNGMEVANVLNGS